jgi:hypothetical protein
MSLLEVILAIAVAGFVLAAAVSLLVSVSRIWSERAERNFFVDHVDGVTEFLSATLSTAGVEIAITEESTSNQTEEEGDEAEADQEIDAIIVSPGEDEETSEEEEEETTGGGLVTAAEEPIEWAYPPGFSESQDPLLNFKLTQAPPLLVGLENAPLLNLDIFLHFDKDDGLSLLWYSSLQEDTENINDLRRTVLSPFVTKVQYIYWDDSFEKWEEEDAPLKGDGDEYLLPRFLKLTFEHEGETQERIITIPVPSISAFIF